MACRDSRLACYCGLPFARLQGSAIVVESRHRGKKHVNLLPISDLVKEIIETGDCSTGDLEDVIRLIESHRMQTMVFKVLIAK